MIPLTLLGVLGLRVLPLVIQIDGKVIDRFYELSAYLNPKEVDAASTAVKDDKLTGIGKVQAQLTALQLKEAEEQNGKEKEVTDPAASVSKNEMYLDSIHIYPLVVQFSIGNNKHRWPVMFVCPLFPFASFWF